ncbi:MAG TPA: hypothetical protein VGK22_04440 [Candidatus Angelobacter sp.]|jgi:hypothetical protein
MKPTGNTPRRSTLTSWQRQPKAKNAVLNRIRNVISELETIQAEMHGDLMEPATDNRSARFFEDPNAMQVLTHFKTELDQLRRILWFYTEDASGKSTNGAAPAENNDEINKEQQANHMLRVNELVRALSPKPPKPETTETKPAVSFFERLEVVMDTYMQDKKPIGQITTIKSTRH